MTQKEFRKINNDMVISQENEYLETNQISKEEYFKAKRKSRNILGGIIIGLWLSVGFLGLVASAIKKAEETPNETVVMQRVDNLGQPSLAFNPNSYIDFYNYSNGSFQYVNQNGTTQPNFIMDFEDPFVRLPYNSAGNATMTIGDVYENDSFYLSDDTNINSYGELIITNEESFNGSFISNYGALEEDMYLDLHTPNVSDIYTRWLLNEQLATNVSRNVTRDISYGNFTIDFNDDYINSYNNFNVIRVEANLKTVDYGYRLGLSLSAYNTSNGYKTLLATTYYSTKSSNNSVVRNSNGTYYLAVKNASNQDFREDFVVMPYLRSLKIHSTSNHPFQYQATQVAFRSWLGYDMTLNKVLPNSLDVGAIDNDRYAETLWGNFGDLMKITFTSLLPMASIVILPGVTIGAIVIAPFVIGLVILMLRLVKKD